MRTKRVGALALALALYGGCACAQAILPQDWHSTPAQPLPPAPPAIAHPQLPASFVGCWIGEARGFDRVTVFQAEDVQIGEPGRIEFCYYADHITVPAAQVRISPAKHALDVLLNLGLGFDTFWAHGFRSDVYRVAPGAIRGRTWLEVNGRFHFLYVLPIDYYSQPSVVDWNALLAGPDRCVMDALQVIGPDDAPEFTGAWHASFRRSQ